MIKVRDNELCPCCSNKEYWVCCKPYIEKSEDDFKDAINRHNYIEAYRISTALKNK